MITMQKKISHRLDADLVEDLQLVADRERVPLSYVLRHLVLRFLRPVPPADLRGGVPAGEGTPQAKTGGQGRFAPAEAAARRFAGSARAETEEEKFRAEVCALFDQFQGQGHDVKEATKRTNFALKARNHPWATFDVISKILRDSGRYRTVRGVRR